MTGDDQCSRIRLDLGVYLLGAMGPGQRAAVHAHLAACQTCRAELAELAGLPALLGRVPAGEASRLLLDGVPTPPPGPPLNALLSRVVKARRRRRRLIAVIALAVAIAAAAGWWQALRSPSQTVVAATVTVGAVNPVTRAAATISYTAEPWGTEVQARITGVPAGSRCELWVTGPHNQEVEAGGWIAAAGRAAALHPASVPFSAPSVRSFQIYAGTRLLVSVAARGQAS
jgi:anti-sigma factor RsiW